jgi:hypothetical protein
MPSPHCELYATGNEVVSRGYPPTPVPPWLVRDPTIEVPFELSRVPLLTEHRRPVIKTFQDWRKPRALAMSATGRYGGAGGKTTEEAIRRALEWCGHNSGVACIILAIDDVFVIRIPSSMKVVGLVRSGPLMWSCPSCGTTSHNGSTIPGPGGMRLRWGQADALDSSSPPDRNRLQSTGRWRPAASRTATVA